MTVHHSKMAGRRQIFLTVGCWSALHLDWTCTSCREVRECNRPCGHLIICFLWGFGLFVRGIFWIRLTILYFFPSWSSLWWFHRKKVLQIILFTLKMSLYVNFLYYQIFFLISDLFFFLFLDLWIGLFYLFPYLFSCLSFYPFYSFYPFFQNKIDRNFLTSFFSSPLFLIFLFRMIFLSSFSSHSMISRYFMRFFLQ